MYFKFVQSENNRNIIFACLMSKFEISIYSKFIHPWNNWLKFVAEEVIKFDKSKEIKEEQP